MALMLGTGIMACAPNGQYELSEGRTAIKKMLVDADMRAKNAQNKEKALAVYADVFKDYSHEPDVALAYAKALRESGYASKAIDVLSPHFAKLQNNQDIAVEYIKDYLAGGMYPAAENMALNWIETDIARQRAAYVPPESADSVPTEEASEAPIEKAEPMVEPVITFYAPYEFYQLAGIAADAQGKLDEGERHFRDALSLVEENQDKAVIMNNLALNLFNQNKVDAAMKLISEAFVIAPDKPKIARNLELISDVYKAAQ